MISVISRTLGQKTDTSSGDNLFIIPDLLSNIFHAIVPLSTSVIAPLAFDYTASVANINS